MKSLTKEVIENLVIDIEKLELVPNSAVDEDNNGAKVVTTSPSMNPTSNHISVKHHWFR